MNKIALSIIASGILIFLVVIFSGGTKVSNGVDNSIPVNNVEVRNGIQYITINAKYGYSPKVSTAKAGIATKLLVDTKGTFDCSASLVVKSVGFQKILPQTGETEIDIGIPKVGEPLRGICGMGMYNFLVNFE